MKKWIIETADGWTPEMGVPYRIFSAVPFKEEEPLAVLANRKDLWINIKKYVDSGWSIQVGREITTGMMRTKKTVDKELLSDKNYYNYTEAELKARAYLNGLHH